VPGAAHPAGASAGRLRLPGRRRSGRGRAPGPLRGPASTSRDPPRRSGSWPFSRRRPAPDPRRRMVPQGPPPGWRGRRRHPPLRTLRCRTRVSRRMWTAAQSCERASVAASGRC